MIPKCSYNKFEAFNRRTFASGWKSKGVWSSRTYGHKSWGKSTDSFNIKNENPSGAWNHGKVETSMVGPLEVLLSLIKRQIGHGSSKSGIYFGRPYMSTFLGICFSLVIETWPKCWWIIWEIYFLISPRKLGQKYSCFFEVWIWQFQSEDTLNYFEYGKLISNNYLEGQQSHNVQDVKM